MPNTYTLITDPIPVGFGTDGIVWDPEEKFLYHRSGFNWPDGSYLYKYDRNQKKLAIAAKVANPWGAFGAPAVDRNQRLYYTREGNANGVTSLTYERQLHWQFFTDNLQPLNHAQRLTGSGECVGVFNQSGEYLADVHSPYQLWWHLEGTDLNKGELSCFSQTQHCASGLLRLYGVPRESFGASSGFFSGTYRVRDIDSDGAGNVWVYVSDTNRHDIFRVDIHGLVHFRRDISASMPNPDRAQGGEIKWYQADNSLIISNRTGFIKYSIDDDAVTAILPNVNYVFNHRSFHHPDQRLTSLWLAETFLDVSVDVPPGAAKDFPAFREIKLDTLEVGQLLVCREVAQSYPLPAPDHLSTKFSPITALQDPDSGCIWAEHGNHWHLGVFCFEGVGPSPGGEGGGGVGATEFCIPHIQGIKPTNERTLGIGPNTRTVKLQTTNERTVTLK